MASAEERPAEQAHAPQTPRHQVARVRYDALVFDLDGVITQTAKTHAAAWKELFDEYLARRAEREGGEFRPFELPHDYRRYVDGRPRYQGVATFLESRGIEVPWGDEADPPERETVCGLGNRKNRYFRLKLQTEGVEVYEEAVGLVRAALRGGFRVALVSSSKNTDAVLAAAELSELFPVRLDGNDIARLDLAGKPAPDMFLAAAEQLEAAPPRCIVLEDAPAGVQAGRAGGFGLVVGVARHGNEQELLAAGADIAVARLDQLVFDTEPVASVGRPVEQLPPALDRVAAIAERLAPHPAAFLDYDGTLSPIVARPEDARLPAGTRRELARLAEWIPIGIISGRSLDDVRERVGLPQLYYAGSHGYEAAGPDGTRLDYQEAKKFLPLLDEAEQELRQCCAKLSGVTVERKRYSLAVHVRLAAEDVAQVVEEAVNDLDGRMSGLQLSRGRKVYDFQPALEWHKGKALMRIMAAMEADGARDLRPFYIGDDTTDENVFRTLSGRGIGIVVRDGLARASAEYALKDPDEVRLFLAALAGLLAEQGQRPAQAGPASQ